MLVKAFLHQQIASDVLSLTKEPPKWPKAEWLLVLKGEEQILFGLVTVLVFGKFFGQNHGLVDKSRQGSGAQ